MLNTDVHAPVVCSEDAAYDYDFKQSLRGIDVNAAGSLFVIDINGRPATYKMVAENLPYRVELQIKRIVGDGQGAVGDGTSGTDIALTALVPFN